MSQEAKEIVAKLMRCLGQVQGQAADVQLADHLLLTYPQADILLAITYVFEKDESRWWMDKVTCMADVVHHMPTLQKRAIGYRQKNKADVQAQQRRSSDPYG